LPTDPRFRLAFRAAATCLPILPMVLAAIILRRPEETSIPRSEVPKASPESAIYALSDWHPDVESLSFLDNLDTGITHERSSRFLSHAMFVYDVDSGEALLERAADHRQPVASLTKLVTGLALASAAPDYDHVICVDERLYPTRNGARSRLSTGDCYQGWDLLGATLVSSDNRAAFGLQVLSGLAYDEFIDRMNDISRALGMGQSSWADPSGLEDDNLSTARDMARAALAVATHPDLSLAANAATWRLTELRHNKVRTLFSTDRLAGRQDIEILSAKTGYTDTAGYCFTGVFRNRRGRTLALAVLGSHRKNGRWKDVERILDMFS
jgi:D-alanyl-D-alanine endopeptidase (penicillin-binding protein 7)